VSSGGYFALKVNLKGEFMRCLTIFLAIVLVCLIAVCPAYAAEPIPGSVCGANGSTMASAQGGSGHFMICESGTWKSIYSYNATGALTKLGNQTCANGEILKFNGSVWACAADSAGSSLWVDGGSGRIYYNGGGVGIGATPDASAVLDAASTAKGFLPPRMTTVQRNAITAPAEGLTLYNTTSDGLETYGNGFWQAGAPLRAIGRGTGGSYNTMIQNVPGGLFWMDGPGSTEGPTGTNSGTLVHLDPLWNGASANKYAIQLATNGNNTGKLYFREQNNGMWGGWVDLAAPLLPALGSGALWVGSAGGAATPVAMSGDGTLSNTGVLAIAGNAIGSAEITDGTVSNADLAGSIAISKLSVPGGTTTYLRADGTWAAVSGSAPACTRRTNSSTNADGSNNATAGCLAGEVMTGGGCMENAWPYRLYQNYPSTNNTWNCAVHSYPVDPTSNTITAYAICCQF
jgi:hypothetical protein